MGDIKGFVSENETNTRSSEHITHKRIFLSQLIFYIEKFKFGIIKTGI
jgi:hypothetical protein